MSLWHKFTSIVLLELKDRGVFQNGYLVNTALLGLKESHKAKDSGYVLIHVRLPVFQDFLEHTDILVTAT